MKPDQQNAYRGLVLTQCRLSDKPSKLLSRLYVSILLGATLMATMPTPSSALTLVANQDAMVDSASSTVNYGAAQSAGISNAGTIQNTFAKFDLAALPKDTVITQATLRIYVNRAADADSTLAVNTVDTDWSEQKLTQDNAPTLKLLASPLAIAKSDTGRYVNYDMTALVKAWQVDAQPNYGIALTAASAAQPCNIAIDTKESTGTSHPMEIEVALEGAKGANGEKGVPGSQGSKGSTGDTGAQGPAGPQGPAGVNGKDGAQGGQGLPSPQGSPGPMGPQGVPGTQGARGNRGADGPIGEGGISGFEKITTSYTLDKDIPGIFKLDAACPSGKLVLSGGCTAVETKSSVVSMEPFFDNAGHSGYSCFFLNKGSAKFVSTYAICANAERGSLPISVISQEDSD